MDWKCHLLILELFLMLQSCETLFSFNDHRVCVGTNVGFTSTGSAQERYHNLKRRYSGNCTYIDGNLEITNLNDPNIKYDLSFLSSIQEVTGYVLIFDVHADYIPLVNLVVIRGINLYKTKDREFSLFVALNYDKGGSDHGLKELRFKSLHEILRGDIRLENNNQLCFDNTIRWDDILSTPSQEKYVSDEGTRRTCPRCHESCQGSCWGSGSDMCQKFTKIDCAQQCDHRCFGEESNQCCYKECAGGCDGANKNQCWACRHFNNDGECVENCPPLNKYDQQTFTLVTNPDAKYTYGSLCADKCPDYLLTEGSACQRRCLADHQEIDKHCEPCDGPCPKSCIGTDGVGINNFVNSLNIKNFTGCTKIDGSLRILTATLEGDPHYNAPPLNISDLDVLKSIRNVTNYVRIESNSPALRNLSFLSGLTTIIGREVDTSGSAALTIYDISSLESLELRSLTKIIRGNVVIMKNENLCYADTVDFSTLVTRTYRAYGRASNKDRQVCRNENKRCDAECSDKGCWGPGNKNCLECRNYQFEDQCISWCNPDDGIYEVADKKECKHCHKECAGACDGPGFSVVNCRQECKHVIDGNRFCVAECPEVKYLNASTNHCESCHELCIEGCTGPGDFVGDGGCNKCELSKQLMAGHYQCMDPRLRCPSDYFERHIYSDPDPLLNRLIGKKVCLKCHDECDTCSGVGPARCEECKHVKMETECRAKCPGGYFDDEKSHICMKCHKQCRRECTGPTTMHCISCNNKKVYTNDKVKTVFNCTELCPKEKPFTIKEKSGAHICSKDDPDTKRATIIIASTVSGGIIILGILMAVFVYLLRQRQRSKERTLRLTAKMTGIDESEPLTPSDAKPDLAKLRLIKESELRKGSIIGSGAFGTVFKGVWIPEGENVKIPVAIKVLQEGTSANQNQELLEEARVMASVDNQCCVRIIAVCMTAEMMLVTQLMPLGCLLDYVRKHRENIGSKNLLNWCTQVAKGMAYLEGRGIVHRDLAARNVLVQSSNQVKITDFGLAKLLDFEEAEYHAAGGKMPIKWLALECIQHRLFTHKTDVWSYGVTVWELFTYGQKPYENVRARDIPDLLEKGERLPQPSMCTIDVYMIMIKCWMLDADSRPSFLELAEEFAKMARDPGRYLVIRGDRLMRLPSTTYDVKEVLRTISVATDGPEEVMEADDYLQPTSEEDPEPTSPESPFSPPYRYGGGSFSKKPLLPSYPEEPQDATGSSQPPPRRDKKYGHLENAATAKNEKKLTGHDRGDSINSRYTSDPLGKHMMLASVREREEQDFLMPLVYDEDIPDAPPIPPPSLPIDEDDYLQPRSQCPQYLDIDDDCIEIDPHDAIVNYKKQGEYENIPDKPLSVDIMTALDNPEYFDSAKISSSNGKLNGMTKKDHDYYNELDPQFKNSKPQLTAQSAV